MDDAVVVDVLQSQDSLGKVDGGHLQREGTHVLQQRRHISTLHVLHHHVQMVLRTGGRRDWEE